MNSITTLKNSPEVRNIIWMVVDRVWRMVISLVVGVWVVRYLGPDQFGQINYVLAFIGIATVVANLGMESFLLKELVANPDSKSKIVQSAFQLRLVFGAIVFIILLIYLLFTGEPLSVLLLFFILVPQLFTTSFTVADLYFQGELKSRITVVVRNVFFVVGAILKILAIVTAQSIYVFALLTILDLVLADIYLFVYYKKKYDKGTAGKISLSYLRALLKQSIPFVVSNLAIVIYMRVDQILLGKLSSVREVGFFTAATKVAEVFYFIPLVITGSLYSYLITARSDSEARYRQHARKIFFVLLLAAVMISLVISLAAKPVIVFLYGNDFMESITVLQIYIWATVSIFAGVAFNQILVIESLSHAILYKTLIGVVLNILLNITLIPTYGALGAAIATIVTQFISSIAANFLFPGARTAFLSYFAWK